MAYDVRINREQKKIIVKKVNNLIKINARSKRGLAGPIGPQGPAGTDTGTTWQNDAVLEAPDGLRTQFTTGAYVAGGIQVYLNGLREGYITEISNTVFEFSTAPASTDEIVTFIQVS